MAPKSRHRMGEARPVHVAAEPVSEADLHQFLDLARPVDGSQFGGGADSGV